MFRRKQATRSPSTEADIWNGWTQRLIAGINEKSHLTFQLESLAVTSWFDAENYAGSAELAASDLATYEEMPSLFLERPAGVTKESYNRSDATIRGREMRLGIGCEIDIIPYSPPDIVSEARAGYLRLGCEDPIEIGAKDGKEFRTPLISATLYDPDGRLAIALRWCFLAALQRNCLSEIKLLLKEIFAVSTESFGEKSRYSYGINQIIVWENWYRV